MIVTRDTSDILCISLIPPYPNNFASLARNKSPITSERLYVLYKQRNEIETMFDSYKNFLKADVMYMQDRHVCEGWLFACLYRYGAYYKLYNRLSNVSLLKKESLKDIIELAKSVHQIKYKANGNVAKSRKEFVKLSRKLE